jgi:hypothetical protein
MDLTICLTCFYKTNLNKFKNQISSLFDERFTPSINLNNLPTPQINITPNKLVELIIIIDTYKNKFDNYKNYEYKNNINNIIAFVKSLNIYNTSIKIYKTKYNSGVSVGRNIGIKQANGKFICFCDDDDLHININETLKIIELYNNFKCINCYMSNRPNVLGKVFFKQSNISPCSGLFNVLYLRNNNLYFPEGIKTEDIIWRSKFYTILSKEKTNSIIDTKIGFYIPLDAGNNSNEVSIQTITRKPNRFNIDNYNQIPYNQLVYDKLNIILKHDINYNEWTIFALTSALNVDCGYSLLNYYALQNLNKFDDYNKNILKLTQHLTNYELNFNCVIDKKECFRMFIKFNSLEDIKSFAKYLMINLNEFNNELNIFNILWKLRHKTFTELLNSYTGNMLRLLIKLNVFIMSNEIKFKTFKNFCFKYCCFKYLSSNLYGDVLSKHIKNILTKLLSIYENNIRNLNISDVAMYINYNSNRILNKSSESLNLYKRYIIKSKNDIELKQRLINYFGNNYDLIIEKYINDNNIKTVNVFENNYKGNILTLLLYILSPKLYNNIIHKSNEFDINNEYSQIYEHTNNSWFGWFKQIFNRLF